MANPSGPTDSFYKRLALLRLITFAVVLPLAVLANGWRRGWAPMEMVLFEAVLLTLMVMVLSLPLAWIRTRLAMDRAARRKSMEPTNRED